MDSQAEQPNGGEYSEHAPASAQPSATAGTPRRAKSSRRKRGASRGGRPASNPARQARSYRDMLRAAGADVEAICEANDWARQHGVPLDGAAELVERHAQEQAERRVQKYREYLREAQGDVNEVINANAWARENGVPLDAEAERLGDEWDARRNEQTSGPPPPSEPPASAEVPPEEPVQPADPDGFASLGDEPQPEVLPPEEPKGPTYMGEPVDMVEAFSQAALFLAGSLAELTRGHPVMDLTRPIERVLFKGTPVERTVRGDPVARVSELTGVGLARRAQRAMAAVDGPAGKPGIGWELVPLCAALGIPLVVHAKGAVVSAARGYMAGARGAAACVGRLLRRGRGG
ncbi:hypothetical protein MYSTI_04154 [Myxococcus stipitatus DSM 14675]|uniref:Uncharacterized protein n=1 Tax=Myxococcus stipitatus (strain DSM 14675 / JCM 12634 / Mx s8) TaxID=1278073 RepID=L7UGA5_MYXSD|nr:hypothetical protein [Myxococcus stipitatus]AGC45454.1 hypothetical protein MYSTI_04154 [Myxococcus stipitatus DSM 14675]